MRSNNKGITLIEIIVSVTLISIVLIFLFSLLIQVNNENSDNEVRASYLVNQSTFTKQIEEDFLDYAFYDAGECRDYYVAVNASSETNSDNIYIPKWNGIDTRFKCLTFRFYDDDDLGYDYAHLFLYQRNDGKTILSYYRFDFKQSAELENFDWDMNVDNSGNQLAVSVNKDTRMSTCSLPIIGPDYNDYSINLSYYG